MDVLIATLVYSCNLCTCGDLQVLQFVHGIVAPLVDVPVAELALQIYLQAAYSASEVAHLEMIAYEFMEQVQPPSPVLNPLSPSIYLTLVLQVPLLQLSAPQFGLLVCLSHAALLCLDASERSTCMFNQSLKDLVEFIQCKSLFF